MCYLCSFDAAVRRGFECYGRKNNCLVYKCLSIDRVDLLRAEAWTGKCILGIKVF